MEIKRINNETFIEFLEPYRERVIEYFGDDEMLEHKQSDEVNFGVYIDGTLCSVCSLVIYNMAEMSPDHGVLIGNCFTAPQYERQGCLTALIEYAKQIAELLQCPLTCIALRETSEPVFKRQGFEITSKEKVSLKYTPKSICC